MRLYFFHQVFGPFMALREVLMKGMILKGSNSFNSPGFYSENGC